MKLRCDPIANFHIRWRTKVDTNDADQIGGLSDPYPEKAVIAGHISIDQSFRINQPEW